MVFKALILGIISFVCLGLSGRLFYKPTLYKSFIFEIISVITAALFYIVAMDKCFSAVQVILSFLFLLLYNFVYCLVHKVPLNFIHSKGNLSIAIKIVTFAFLSRLAFITFV